MCAWENDTLAQNPETQHHCSFVFFYVLSIHKPHVSSRNLKIETITPKKKKKKKDPFIQSQTPMRFLNLTYIIKRYELNQLIYYIYIFFI